MLGLLAAGALAAPVLDAFASPCSGNGDYDSAVGSIVGKCYEGSAKVLTIAETAIIQIKSFDEATGQGTLKVGESHGSGTPVPLMQHVLTSDRHCIAAAHDPTCDFHLPQTQRV